MAEGVSAVGGWFGWCAGGNGVVGSGDGRVVWRGKCGADMCDLFPVTAGEATSFHSRLILIQRTPGSWWLCCSCRWSWCFRFCLFGGKPPWGHCVFVIFTISMLFSVCVVVVMRGDGIVSVEVVVVALCWVLWGCLGEVWMDGRGFFGLGFGVKMVCGRKLYKGVVGAV